MKVYIGNENILSPLGTTAQSNYEAVCAGNSGVRKIKNAGFAGEDLHLSTFTQPVSFESLVAQCLAESKIPQELIQSPTTKIILSTTKGDLNAGVTLAMQRALALTWKTLQCKHQPLLLSNACISGVLAISKAAEMIRAKLYDNVIVIACDLVSPFVIYGFQSLYALGTERCKPYDSERNGINLGEGCAVVMLSNSQQAFAESPLVYLSGGSSNDANHISGPSRTGEGLVRAIQKTLTNAQLTLADIGFINAHGTATKFNDDMESVAFSRLLASKTPVNSLKAYFGHTLGAAGVIETAISMQALRNQTRIKSLGYNQPGTPELLSIIDETSTFTYTNFLKTASGFGGGNASILIGMA